MIEKYKEIPCKACEGTGVFNTMAISGEYDFYGQKTYRREPIKTICEGCHGRGSQTVLDEKEVNDGNTEVQEKEQRFS